MNDQNSNRKKTSLGIKFQVAIILLFVSVMLINFLWTYHAEKQELLEIATEKAGIIVREYLAAIEFAIQNVPFEEDKDGKPTVHQNILSLGEAGTKFSEMLSLFADFEIKMVSDMPRNVENSPDLFEQSALSSFERNPVLKSVYKEIKRNNKNHLRYVVPLRITKNCLFCHGEPEGEMDITGYEKEGYKLGEIRGAISLTIPLFTEYKHRLRYLINLILFYFIITVLAVIVSYFILDKMVALNKEINAMNVQLQEQHETLIAYEEEKANLIEMIVHDLKNPLTTITSGLEVVLESNTVEDERLHALLMLSFSGAKRLSGMISDILDVSAMENKKYMPECVTIDIKKYMTNVFNELSMTLKSKVKSLKFVFKSEFPPFQVEPNLLKRVLENIIFNAIKHSPPKHAEITTSVEYLDYSDEILVSIRDKGEGIAKENLEKIFDKFYQVEGKKRSGINKGLGLTFCKFAVDLMGGRIWAESESGEATTFYFTLGAGDECCRRSDDDA